MNLARIIFISILALALFFAGCLPHRENKILVSAPIGGFEQVGAITVYNKNTLFDYMNGEADVYFPLGFHLLYVSLHESERTGSRMVLEIYDMTSSKGAAAALEEYSAGGGSSVSGIGKAAWADKGIVLFTEGRYFARIFPDPSPENQGDPTMEEMLDLARAATTLLR